MCKAAGWLIAVLAVSGPVAADDSDGSWAARAQAGYAKTGGNTDTSTATALFHIAHVIEGWKFLFGAEGFYGSTKGQTTAQSWDAHLQANYNINERLYWYGGLRYDDNKVQRLLLHEAGDALVG